MAITSLSLGTLVGVLLLYLIILRAQGVLSSEYTKRSEVDVAEDEGLKGGLCRQAWCNEGSRNNKYSVLEGSRQNQFDFLPGWQIHL